MSRQPLKHTLTEMLRDDNLINLVQSDEEQENKSVKSKKKVQQDGKKQGEDKDGIKKDRSVVVVRPLKKMRLETDHYASGNVSTRHVRHEKIETSVCSKTSQAKVGIGTETGTGTETSGTTTPTTTLTRTIPTKQNEEEEEKVQKAGGNENEGGGLSFKCSSCRDLLCGRIYQCTEGHLLCEECHGRMTQCPQCHKLFPKAENGGIRNRALEQLLEKSIYSHLKRKDKDKDNDHLSLTSFLPPPSHVKQWWSFERLDVLCHGTHLARTRTRILCRGLLTFNSAPFTKHYADKHAAKDNHTDHILPSPPLLDHSHSNHSQHQIHVDEDSHCCHPHPPSPSKMYEFSHSIKFPGSAVKAILHSLLSSNSQKQATENISNNNGNNNNVLFLKWQKICQFADGAKFFLLLRFIGTELRVLLRCLNLKHIFNEDDYILKTIVPYVQKYEQHFIDFYQKNNQDYNNNNNNNNNNKIIIIMK
ncbi:hypothetical protein RFI_21564 [Reticulomyxa filosa]|uniref:E3 ubiquitin-protein ligase Sina-like RING finger domain-containing protein n=1 Tax=Reticulomyxa filosa TaxID=46433 RepID=X6MQ74_RETFI|nr:hypothetical protein RFI_21564 [Reticulomyxa filosa]|eukprot:ETO15801.1 hypothetical protein RFI_21564 [Reticulomyxa filosa]